MLWSLQISRMSWLRERNVVEAEEHEILSYWRSVNSEKHDNREPQFYAISAATNNNI
jgi:hypothetical protein